MALDKMIESSVCCALCGTRGRGNCDCWEQCSCGWTVQRGGECTNPEHAIEQLAVHAAANVITHMRGMYREPMRAASGGFEKTLHATIIREVRAAFKP